MHGRSAAFRGWRAAQLNEFVADSAEISATSNENGAVSVEIGAASIEITALSVEFCATSFGGATIPRKNGAGAGCEGGWNPPYDERRNTGETPVPQRWPLVPQRF